MMSVKRGYFSGLLASLAVAQTYAAESLDLTLHIPTKKPAWAEKLSPNLASFSIEMDRWTDWAGEEVGKPNEYFNQLLTNLGERTGHMPMLRVGADSEDRATVDLSFQVMNATFPAPTADAPNPEADKILIGRDFYALSGNLPAGTQFMWGLNLKSLNISETVSQARLLAEAFQGSRADLTKNVNLFNVEIGNEPDFYDFAGWDVINYTTTWESFAKAVSQEIDFGCGDSSKPTLSPGAFTGFVAPEWIPQATLEDGLLEDQAIECEISQFAEHSYSGGYSPTVVYNSGELMDKLTVRTNMSTKASNRIAVRSTGLQYILGETNSYANHGVPGLSNTIESALWAVDWLLLGASSGIERLHFHHGVGYRYNTIQPVADSGDGLNITRAHILPSYYSFLIVNEAIGKSGNAYVVEIPTTNASLTAYGIWEKTALKRLVVLNTQVYLGEGEKSSITVHLPTEYTNIPATVKYLVSDNTTSYSGITWAGQSFETISGKPEGNIVQQKINGGAFVLPASSIALLSFESG